MFTISNGYLGLKGNVAEDRDGYSPVTLVNGIYDELDMFGTIRASNEDRRYLDSTHFDSAGKSPAIANLPNPLFVRLFVGDQEISLTRGDVLGFVQGLDLRCGMYSYQFQFRDAKGRTTRVAMTRFASMTHVHRVFMRYVVTPLDHDAPIRIRSGIDARAHSNTTGERQFTVTEAYAEQAERCVLHARTPARRHAIEMAVTNSCHGQHTTQAHAVVEHDAVYTEYSCTPIENQPIQVDRVVVVRTSEDQRHHTPIVLHRELSAAVSLGFDGAQTEQREWWERAWARADVQIDGDKLAQRYLRFCLYHLIAGAPRHADTLPIPVKLLTGEYYQGNTFYDTDLYIVPMLTFVFPELARGALNFRHLALEPGRAIAEALDCDGAKFAWQSGPYGEECLGNWWMFTHTNVHINADVVYALMQYAWATNDREFMRKQGLGILIESARFYASRVEQDEQRDAYDLHGVTGPDEGHVAVTNDFYTNWLVRQTLKWAADLCAEYSNDEVPTQFGVTDEELGEWRDISERLTLLYDDGTKVYEQCTGFYQLKTIPPKLSRERQVWFETVFPYQALNQPDVVMAMMMFRDDFPQDVQRANWEFYKDKSMDFSSMSFVINSIMAADMGEIDTAYQNFLISAGEDLDEDLTGRKDTYAGLHGTASGGAWMAAVFGFGGVNLSSRGLRINPKLPPKWKALRFNMVLRGVTVRVEITRHEVVLIADEAPGFELSLTVAGKPLTLCGGNSVRTAYHP
ncbi:MAG: glycoside hydrolase family 65 protein [Phycisphaerae bacterium]|nr:glycoside hydrolase family 65 protein [Phycisphaerae bacterium]